MSITFETHICWAGDIGRAFADALAERARRGLKVHVLLDRVGSAKMDDSLLAVLTQAGVQVRRNGGHALRDRGPRRRTDVVGLN